MKNKTILWCIGGTIALVLYGFFDPAQYHFPLCPFHLVTGWLCPGCGSQRAMHQLLLGNFGMTMKLNPLFLPGLLYALCYYVFSFFLHDAWGAIRQKFYGMHASYICLAIICIFWIGRNVF